jgi:hypothetical protein
MRYKIGEILAPLVLSAIAAGLVFAALYAVLGKPATAEGRKRKQHIVNGFRLAGGVLLGFVLVATFIAAFRVGVLGAKPAPMSFSSRPLALAEAAVSLTFIMLLMQRWAKYLALWNSYGVLNGLVMAISGHRWKHPAIPVSRSWALMLAGIALLSVLMCLRFAEDYELNLVDKIAVMGWVVCFAIAVTVEKYGLVAMALAAAGLSLAWIHHRLITPPMRPTRGHSIIRVNLRRSR